MATLSVAAVALAYLSWKYVEIPLRNRQRFKRKQIVAYGLVGSAFFVVTGLVTNFNNGFENRFNATFRGDIGHLDFHKYVSDKYFTCTPNSIAEQALRWEGFTRCMQSKQGLNVNIALVGDSHAEHLFLGLAESLNRKNVAFYIKGSNPFIDNPEFETIFHHVLKSDSIDTVLLTMQWVFRVDQIPKNSTLENKLLITLKTLIDAGKTVYLIDDIPRFPFQPERCKFPFDFVEPVCDIEKSKILEYENAYVPILHKIAEKLPAVRLINLRDLLCDEARCSMVRNGVLMYRDNNHLNILGSQYIGHQIAKSFPELNK